MILLVEDDPLLAEATYLMLDLQGYTVSVAQNGREALTQLTWQKPDLIITDWHMPEMNGVELCHAVRCSSEFGAIPLMLMSGLRPRVGKHAPFDAFLQKPFLAAKMLAEVYRLLNPGAHTYRRGGSNDERV